MKVTAETDVPWRDLTDPRRAAFVEDLEAGLKEPIFENLEIPEKLGPVTILVDDHKIKRFSFTQDDYSPWYLQGSPFDGARIGQPCLLGNDLVQLFTTRYRASKTVGFHTDKPGERFQGRVSAVSLRASDNQVMLSVGDMEVPFSNVERITL